jgi:AraC-like DNA-binding protein
VTLDLSAAVSYLLLLVVFQCLIFALFLASWWRGGRGQLFLAVLLGSLGAHLGSEFLQSRHVLPEEVSPAQLFGLAYGPLFFLWVRSATTGRAFRRADGMHFLPFACAVAVFATGRIDEEVLAVAVFTSIGIYLLVSARMAAEPGVHPGMRLALAGLAVIYLLDIVSFTSATSSGSAAASALLFAGLLLYVTSFVFAALRGSPLFAPASFLPVPLWAGEEIRDLEHLERSMEKERLYLRPDLTLAEIALAAGLPPRRVSLLINRGRDMNVTEWVNQYRIAEARRLLQSSELTVLEVAHESGFNSKSTFNAVFKDRTGVTPTHFRRRGAPGA